MTTPTRSREETNKAVVTEFMEVFSRGDVDAILAFLTDDATWWALTPRALAAEGDRVAAETESYAELANGRVYNNLDHFVFELSDGRIRHVKEYLDTEHTRAVFLGD